MKKLTRDRVVPTISARVSCVIWGRILLGFTGFSELRQQEKDSRQPLFTGVEELVDQVSLSPHTAGEEKLEEQIGECVLLVHHTDHLCPLDLERSTSGNGRRCRQAKSHRSGERLFTDKVAGREKGDGCFFARGGNDGQLSSPAEDKR